MYEFRARPAVVRSSMVTGEPSGFRELFESLYLGKPSGSARVPSS
jgi:hypothetical protein